jgi:23S rRNA (adenine2503-C2)-methyltransferase
MATTGWRPCWGRDVRKILEIAALEALPGRDEAPRGRRPPYPEGTVSALPLVFDAPRRGLPPRHLADLDPAARREAVAALGERPFRAEQLSRHWFAGRTVEQMSDLPAAVRERLAADLLPPLLTRVRDVDCDDGATRKTLWRGQDGTLVESVLMRYPDRSTVCVSSQAGCGMACPFCATGQAGLTRNLSTAEIVEQVVDAARIEAARGGRLSNVVFMGMGEPLANYARVVGAVRRITDAVPHGLGLGQRGVVVSTVGLVPAIEKLTRERLQVTLALSLHAPDDELRDTLVPVNTRWPVREVLDAAFGYTRTTGRRLSIEYALIRDVNDQPERADLLARRLRGKLVHVNLIPLNPTPGSAWDASPEPVQREFVRRLRAAGFATTVRDTRGREIAGACGQLSAAETDLGVPGVASAAPVGGASVPGPG